MSIEVPNPDPKTNIVKEKPPVKSKAGPPVRSSFDHTLKQRVTAMLLLVILSTSFGFAGGYFGKQANSASVSSNSDIQKQIISSESELITQIAKDVGESVVSIDVTSQATRETVFGSRSVDQQSAGTGIIINTDGTIITNRHVIPAGTSSVSVTLSDGTQLKNVEVIGRTNESDSLDIAFLKITDKQGKELKAAKLGDSSKVQVGERVIAIGNALGQFQNTVTDGIISGYGRNLEAGEEGAAGETLSNLFQTDAAINEGNSGGPLVNINGEVIGINTAIAAGGAQNIGFAIPINDTKGLVASVEKNGKLLRPYLGVRYVTLTDDYAYYYNLNTKRGAYIAPDEGTGQSPIIAGSPAEKAGLKEKDIITKINDDAVDEKNSLISLLGKHTVGDKVTLTIVRGDKTQTIDVILEAAPQD